MNRRRFIRQAATITSSAAIAGALPFRLPANPAATIPDLVVCKGADHYEAVKKAIGAAGGIRKFIADNATLGLLVNSRFDFMPALVKPDITIALIELLMETNPREIVLLQVIDDPYWEMGSYSDRIIGYKSSMSQVASNIFPSEYNEEDFIILQEISGGKFVKNAEMVKRFFEVDAFINVPVIKHHGTTLLTGALKNMMGLTTRKTNVGFHLDSGVRNDPEYLAQCIADINLVRKPDLVLADATELIVNNGPSGPGDTVRPDCVIIGRDPVAVDAFGSRFLNLYPEDVQSIIAAYESGVGEMHMDELEILNMEV